VLTTPLMFIFELYNMFKQELILEQIIIDVKHKFFNISIH